MHVKFVKESVVGGEGKVSIHHMVTNTVEYNANVLSKILFHTRRKSSMMPYTQFTEDHFSYPYILTI